jgi:inhibitor of KinA sporulation pathway (predicted exonuclease)
MRWRARRHHLSEPEQQSNWATWGESDLPVLAADFLFITLALLICVWVVFGQILPRLAG